MRSVGVDWEVGARFRSGQESGVGGLQERTIFFAVMIKIQLFQQQKYRFSNRAGINV